MTDINKQQAKEIAEQNLQCQQQAIMDSLPVVMLLLDEDGKYLEIIAGEQNQLYLAKDELLGKRLHDVFPQETADLFLDAIHKTLEQDKVVTLEYELDVIKGHTYFTGRLSPMDHQVDGKRVILFLAIDITEQKTRDLQLQHSVKMDAVGELTGGIAHNLNNIQTIIIGNLDYLKSRTHNDEQSQKFVNKAIDASARCSRLIKQLLTFASHQHGDVMPININKIIAIMDDLIDRSMTPSIKIEHHLKEDLWQTKMDPGEFENVLLNILMNAHDAMPGGGTLSITTCNRVLSEDEVKLKNNLLTGEYVELIITDTGSGMSKQTLEKVFEPFFTTKEVGKNTGLGLSVVYGFVQSLNGGVNIKSNTDSGTTVTLYLPRTLDITETSARTTARPAASENNTSDNTDDDNRDTETILVVDDEVALLALAQEQLEDLGYRVYAASNALQALQLLKDHEEIDLMFSDVIMPDSLNGYELAMKAQELRPELKLLLASGFTADVMEGKGLKLCEVEVLNKPYRYEQLSSKLREILDL